MGGAGGAGGAGAMGGAGGMGGAPPVCGDGVLASGEDCDDGNTAPGDGCSPSCAVEMPDACPGTTITLAPPALVIVDTLAGKSGDLTPSCGTNGADVIYAVTPTVSGTLTATLSGDFDKSLSIRARCGDGLTSEITCATGSSDVARGIWVHAGVTYYVVVDGSPSKFSLLLGLSVCGDGIKQGLEQCDDPADPSCVGCLRCKGTGEFEDPDTHHCYRLATSKTQTWSSARAACVAWGGDLAGLSSQKEYNFVTAKIGGQTWIGGITRDKCTYEWSNGERWRSEWADNEPSTTDERCVEIDPGKGKKMNDEGCDDTDDFLCERAPAGSCGDKMVQPGEGCDDGNTANGDGCDAACQLELSCDAAMGEFDDPATGHCYRVFTSEPKGFYDAKIACELAGGHLAVIDTSAENTLVAQHVSASAWIGGWEGGFNDKTIAWEAPNPACFQNWKSGEPNSSSEDCVEIQQSGGWNDANCGNALAFVCEREP